jgi:hypothetical protein
MEPAGRRREAAFVHETVLDVDASRRVWPSSLARKARPKPQKRDSRWPLGWTGTRPRPCSTISCRGPRVRCVRLAVAGAVRVDGEI